MEPSIWQHQSVQPSDLPVAHTGAVNAFVSGLLIGGVVVGVILLRLRRRPVPRITNRRVHTSGWVDLFRLLAALARGALWLVVALLLVGRVLFWPAGRRW
jgi:hypothetical protein